MSPSSVIKLSLGALTLATLGTQALSQPVHQPYADLDARAIKALSAEQIEDLAAGRGMGLALTAELNGYPGPAHVIEWARQLDLTEPQHSALKRQFEAMQTEAKLLGQELVGAEQELDRAFADGKITPERLKAATASIAAIAGELRHTHLKYHLSTAALLSADQIRRYAELRGYSRASAGRHAPSSGVRHGAPSHRLGNQHLLGQRH